MVDVKYLVIYETWVDYEDSSQNCLAVFDNKTDAIAYMNSYSAKNNFGHPESSNFILDYFNLSHETLPETSWQDGHCFRIYEVPYKPEII